MYPPDAQFGPKLKCNVGPPPPLPSSSPSPSPSTDVVLSSSPSFVVDVVVDVVCGVVLLLLLLLLVLVPPMQILRNGAAWDTAQTIPFDGSIDDGGTWSGGYPHSGSVKSPTGIISVSSVSVSVPVSVPVVVLTGTHHFFVVLSRRNVVWLHKFSHDLQKVSKLPTFGLAVLAGTAYTPNWPVNVTWVGVLPNPTTCVQYPTGIWRSW